MGAKSESGCLGGSEEASSGLLNLIYRRLKHGYLHPILALAVALFSRATAIAGPLSDDTEATTALFHIPGHASDHRLMPKVGVRRTYLQLLALEGLISLRSKVL